MINMLMMLPFYRRATRREKTAWQIHPYYGDEEWALGCFEKSQPYTRAASSRTVSSTTKRKPKPCWDGREVRMKMQMRTGKHVVILISRGIRRTNTVTLSPQQFREHLSFTLRRTEINPCKEGLGRDFWKHFCDTLQAQQDSSPLLWVIVQRGQRGRLLFQSTPTA